MRKAAEAEAAAAEQRQVAEEEAKKHSAEESRSVDIHGSCVRARMRVSPSHRYRQCSTQSAACARIQKPRVPKKSRSPGCATFQRPDANP
eukprot:5529739-Amphidinium_carterae.1